MRLSRLALPAALFLTLSLVVGSYAEKLKVEPRDEWMGVYLGGIARIGYTHTVVDRTTFSGKKVHRLREDTKMDFSIPKVPRFIYEVTMTSYLDSTLTPVRQICKVRMQDGDEQHTVNLTADYKPESIECTTEAVGEVDRQNIRIPAGTDLSTYFKYKLGVARFELGDKIKVSRLNPFVPEISDITYQVLRRERIAVGDRFYDAMAISVEAPPFCPENIEEVNLDGASMRWLLDDGSFVEIMTNHYMLIRERQEEAKRRRVLELPDLPPMFKADLKIADPLQVMELGVRLLNVWDERLLIADARQSVRYSPEKMTAEYNIVERQFDSTKSIKLPCREKEYSQWLVDGDGIEASSKEIQAQARQIIGDEANAYKAACRIRSWVYDNMVGEDNEAPDESAVAILKAKAGRCRHCAVLYTALARAAGIPTRLIAGLVYDDGAFWGHAWAESYVGEWVPVDATRPTDLVDATHIKLVELKPRSGFVRPAVESILIAQALARLKIDIFLVKSGPNWVSH